MVAVHGFHYNAAALLLSGNPDRNPAVPLDRRGASILGLWDIIYNLYIARKHYFFRTHIGSFKISAL